MSGSDTKDVVVVFDADNYEGQGGSYEMVNGKRVLVHRTEEAAPAVPAQADGGPGPAAESKAAAVGVAPAQPEDGASIGLSYGQTGGE